MRYCTQCRAQNDDLAQYCSNCRTPLMAPGEYPPMQPVNRGPIVDWQKEGADKKLAAGLCGILLGGFGVHKFILGYTTEGILEIVITVCTCGVGHFIGLIEG